MCLCSSLPCISLLLLLIFIFECTTVHAGGKIGGKGLRSKLLAHQQVFIDIQYINKHTVTTRY